MSQESPKSEATEPQSFVPPQNLRGVKWLFDLTYRSIFGFDYFIAYTWRDENGEQLSDNLEKSGRLYAERLRAELQTGATPRCSPGPRIGGGMTWTVFPRTIRSSRRGRRRSCGSCPRPASASARNRSWLPQPPSKQRRKPRTDPLRNNYCNSLMIMSDHVSSRLKQTGPARLRHEQT